MQMRRWLAGIGRDRWDMAIDCQGLARTGLMLRASKAPIRIGDRAAREGAWLACNRRVRVPAGTHEVDRMLLLAAAAGAAPVADPTLYVPPDRAAWWAQRREDLPGGRGAALAVASRWASKAWPISHWADLAERIVRDGLARWIALPGSGGEAEHVAAAADAMRSRGVEVVDFSGQTDAGQLMAMIDAAAFTVSNDSAALHMALGLGARCLGLYGPTDPAIVGPWNRPDLAIRAPLNEGERPAYRDRTIGDSIMRRLDVDSVMARIESLAEHWAR
jgi:ADP-heptose:LPS heptosyltransferase